MTWLSRASAACAAAVLALVATLALSPAPATASGSSDWTVLSAGFSHTCGIRTSGRLYCWGANTYGQLGNGSTTTTNRPAEIVGGLTKWTAVSAGDNATCGVAAKRLYCWGKNSDGQLGDGTTTQHTSPTQVSGTSATWSSVSVGYRHVCARKTSKRLYCWGDNTDGQLGDGTTTARSVPTQVSGSSTSWSSVTTGNYHTCARKTSGRIYCWGTGVDGELGTGSLAQHMTPTQVAGSSTSWSSVSAAEFSTCARKTSGRIYCWGSNVYGTLGDGTTNNHDAPTQVYGGATDWTAVAVGWDHTCGRKKSGRLYCWGADNVGQVGNGSTATAVVTPVQVAGGATDWAAASLGTGQSCALTRTGRAYCWGDNSYGELGDYTTSNRGTPTEVYAP